MDGFKYCWPIPNKETPAALFDGYVPAERQIFPLLQSIGGRIRPYFSTIHEMPVLRL
jgi:hypothetical protein